ncbi:MAG: hypothetical protein JNN30_06350 [Rhodanobacteraceae bacterium]|nr:hypothetical protein [Rhodanobacteraceae bacterium]
MTLRAKSEHPQVKGLRRDAGHSAMALLIYGKSVCALCGRVINQNELTCSFPPFVVNELDACFVFSDGAFHEACVRKHMHGIDALRRVDEWASRVGPGKRKCIVCEMEVADPDDYLLIDHLSDREEDPLREFNYTHLHRSYVQKWNSRSRFVDLAAAALASDSWKGPYLIRLIEEIGAKSLHQ